MLKSERCERKKPWTILRYYSGSCMEGVMKTTGNLQNCAIALGM
jgi:hypothetical protein